MQRRLAGRRFRDEEARIEDLRHALGRDPVAVVREPRRIQPDAEPRTDVGHADLVVVQTLAQREEFVGRDARQVDGGALLVDGEQQAGLLEAFADRADPEAETAVGQAEARARTDVVEASAQAMVRTVRGGDEPAGEDGGATVLVAGTIGAPQQQHLQAARRVAQHDQRRGVTGARRRDGRIGGRGRSGGGCAQGGHSPRARRITPA
ncbi:hypothetical protein ABXN37_22605 [Piscinibacter sakaiensis]|uniref:hypothetical protein n=1 Tax=Piscinibacter sakaiensis TaxID=1547922 RepID=UPI003727F891